MSARRHGNAGHGNAGSPPEAPPEAQANFAQLIPYISPVQNRHVTLQKCNCIVDIFLPAQGQTRLQRVQSRLRRILQEPPGSGLHTELLSLPVIHNRFAHAHCKDHRGDPAVHKMHWHSTRADGKVHEFRCRRCELLLSSAPYGDLQMHEARLLVELAAQRLYPDCDIETRRVHRERRARTFREPD